MTGVYGVRKLEEIQKKDVEKDGARELAVGMLLDPRRWGEVKIQNLPLTTSSNTKFAGQYISTPIFYTPLIRKTIF